MNARTMVSVEDVMAPIAYAVGMELGRLDAVGPTVSGLRLDSPYGMLALLLGRGSTHSSRSCR